METNNSKIDATTVMMSVASVMADATSGSGSNLKMGTFNGIKTDMGMINMLEEFRSNLQLLLHCRYTSDYPLRVNKLEWVYQKYFMRAIRPEMMVRDAKTWYDVFFHLEDYFKICGKAGSHYIKPCAKRTEYEMTLIARLAIYNHLSVSQDIYFHINEQCKCPNCMGGRLNTESKKVNFKIAEMMTTENAVVVSVPETVSSTVETNHSDNIEINTNYSNPVEAKDKRVSIVNETTEKNSVLDSQEVQTNLSPPVSSGEFDMGLDTDVSTRTEKLNLVVSSDQVVANNNDTYILFSVEELQAAMPNAVINSGINNQHSDVLPEPAVEHQVYLDNNTATKMSVEFVDIEMDIENVDLDHENFVSSKVDMSGNSAKKLKRNEDVRQKDQPQSTSGVHHKESEFKTTEVYNVNGEKKIITYKPDPNEESLLNARNSKLFETAKYTRKVPSRACKSTAVLKASSTT